MMRSFLCHSSEMVHILTHPDTVLKLSVRNVVVGLHFGHHLVKQCHKAKLTLDPT